MIFNSTEFLIFFPIVVLLYYVLPCKIRYVWLLAASYYFYMNWDALYVLLLFFYTLCTYIISLIIDKTEGKKRKFWLVLCILIALGVLGFFKYCNFAVDNLNRVLSIVNLKRIDWQHNIILPVGISFYTLQALGYLIDVYRGDVPVEKNFFRYALFIAFFPQLVAGPIERSKNLLVQLRTPKKLELVNFRQGAIFMLWGFFLKVAIADRAAIIVNTVYEDPGTYTGFLVAVATFFFAVQVYCDFYGYSIIVKGAARFLGIELMDNFNAPYFSQSVKEFWRRWHISLSGWFRDYLYIPLGGNKKGIVRKHINLLIVFMVSGLWHGASFAYIVWGALNGIYQMIEEIYLFVKAKVLNFLGIKDNAVNTVSRKVLKRAVTLCLLGFSLIFFRAGSMLNAVNMIKSLAQFDLITVFDGSIYTLGVVKECFNVLIIFIIALGFVDYQKYKGNNVTVMLLKQEWWFRILIEMLLLFAILLFGCYGVEYDTNEFIYFQF